MRWLRSLRKARRELRVRVACALCGALLGAVLATTSMAALLRYLRTLPQPRGRVPSFPDHNAAENQIERLRIIMSAPALARCLLTRSVKYIYQRNQSVSLRSAQIGSLMNQIMITGTEVVARAKWDPL